MSAKGIVKSVLATRLGQRALCLRKPQASIVALTYHRVTTPGDVFDGPGVDQFRRQMKWLKAHCHTVAPYELEVVTHSQPRRKPQVLVTFDDGFRCHYTHAYPILEELKIPHVVFLATQFMDQGGMIWSDEVTYMVRRARVSEVRPPWDEDRRVRLDTPAARRAFEFECKTLFKRLPDPQRRALQAALGRALKMEAGGAELPRQMLSWDEVRATSAWTYYGGHTHSHPILSRLSEADAEGEIRQCSERITQETGRAPVLFAYPNGQPGDFTEATKQALKRHGFSHAFTTVGGRYGAGMDRLAIHRQPTGCRTLGDFAWLVQER